MLNHCARTTPTSTFNPNLSPQENPISALNNPLQAHTLTTKNLKSGIRAGGSDLSGVQMSRQRAVVPIIAAPPPLSPETETERLRDWRAEAERREEYTRRLGRLEGRGWRILAHRPRDGWAAAPSRPRLPAWLPRR
jgi:hypothetical protein